MTQVLEDVPIHCPFCQEQIFIRADLSAGEAQSFVYDCEVCCRPISVTMQLDNHGKLVACCDTE